MPKGYGVFSVEEAVKAVKSYDYERAIMLLRQYELH